MALPSIYSDKFDAYFVDIMSFLKRNEFLINYSNIDILSKSILSKFPKHWIDYVSEATLKDLSHFPTGDAYPQTMTDFLEELLTLTPKFDDKWFKEVGSNIQNDAIIIPSLSIKKQHEIFQLSQIIHTKISECDVKHVIDLGSGLGYLCQLLHSLYGVNVLGVEADINRVNTARLRQEKYHKPSKGFVKYIQHFITEQSSELLEQSFDETFEGGHDFFIVGLHACADLSVTALRLFLNMERCKGLIIMPCCYHKMALKPQLHNEDENILIQRFENFPLSNSLKGTSSGFFQRPFMRLACQRSQASWEHSLGDNHKSRTFHLMCRATLEVYASQENGRLVKHGKRKIFNKTLADSNDFDAFLIEAESNFMIKKSEHINRDQISSRECIQNKQEDLVCDETPNNCNVHTQLQFLPQHSSPSDGELYRLDKQKILNIWSKLTPLDFKLATFYTVLQDSLQIVCENIVLLDKLAYIKEQHIEVRTCSYIKITNEIISPRCLALIVEK